MTRDELEKAVYNIQQQIECKRVQLYKIMYDYCKENSPFEAGDNVEIDGRMEIIEDLILDSYYQVVCVFYYADNKGERHTISEKDFHKINKVFDK